MWPLYKQEMAESMDGLPGSTVGPEQGGFEVVRDGANLDVHLS